MAIRVQTAIGLISLIDGERQHILAEASGYGDNSVVTVKACADMWLGNSVIPRQRGLCGTFFEYAQQTLHQENGGAIVLSDLSKDDRFASHSFVVGAPFWRFYAGVPLMSPDGLMIGILCVFDSKPRPELSLGDRLAMQDVASMVAEHLECSRIKEESIRAKRMLEGLNEFVQSSAASISDVITANDVADKTEGISKDAFDNHVQVSKALEGNREVQKSLMKVAHDEKHVRPKYQPRKSMGEPTERDIYTRAAQILRTASDLDGVMFADISAMERSKHSKLSFNSSSAIDISSWEKFFSKSLVNFVLQRCSQGRLFEYDGTDLDSCTDDELSDTQGSGTAPDTHNSQHQKRGKPTTTMQDIDIAADLSQLITDARAVAIFPLWNPRDSRWTAISVCWTNQESRPLSHRIDLTYFKTFGSSVVSEILQLRQRIEAQEKSSFMNTLSHELLSPLHGILGGVDMLQTTTLSPAQLAMAQSIGICGRTMFDTVNHAINFNKRRTAGGTDEGDWWGSVDIRDPERVRFGSNPAYLDTSGNQTNSLVDIAKITEEAVEAVFVGQCFGGPTFEDQLDGQVTTPMIGNGDNREMGTRLNSNETIGKIEPLKIILEIDRSEDWTCRLPTGAFRRIVMNLFGNALKFTREGYVRILLRMNSSIEPSGNVRRKLTFSVKDTGIGMSKDFISTRLFSPFTQGDEFSSGLGLGLTVVRHAVDSIGGKIDVRSRLDAGTILAVHLDVPSGTDQQTPLSSPASSPGSTPSAAIRVCIVAARSSSLPHGKAAQDGRKQVLQALEDTLVNWFHAEVRIIRKWSHHDADLIICSEPSFELLTAIRKSSHENRTRPRIVFLTSNPSEAAALEKDARLEMNRSDVSVISQPYGPSKLRVLIDACSTALEYFEPQAADRKHSNLRRYSSGLQAVARMRSHSPHPVPTIVTPDGPKERTVLIVDDSSVNRRLLVAFCKRNKLQYIEAANGLEAFQIYQQAASDIDLVLMGEWSIY